MSIIGRIFMVIIAYVLACIAASLVLAIGTLSPEWDELTSLGMQSAGMWALVALGAGIIGTVGALPALLLIALAEGFAWRAIVIYGVLGGGLALALTYGLDFAGYVGEPGSYFVREREVLAASGIAGGLVYWLFAGRNAGSWKR